MNRRLALALIALVLGCRSVVGPEPPTPEIDPLASATVSSSTRSDEPELRNVRGYIAGSRLVFSGVLELNGWTVEEFGEEGGWRVALVLAADDRPGIDFWGIMEGGRFVLRQAGCVNLPECVTGLGHVQVTPGHLKLSVPLHAVGDYPRYSWILTLAHWTVGGGNSYSGATDYDHGRPVGQPGRGRAHAE